MKPQSALTPPDPVPIDRKVIRFEPRAAHAGIMTALRRAFEDAAREPCDRDFAELLRQLN